MRISGLNEALTSDRYVKCWAQVLSGRYRCILSCESTAEMNYNKCHSCGKENIWCVGVSKVWACQFGWADFEDQFPGRPQRGISAYLQMDDTMYELHGLDTLSTNGDLGGLMPPVCESAGMPTQAHLIQSGVIAHPSLTF